VDLVAVQRAHVKGFAGDGDLVLVIVETFEGLRQVEGSGLDLLGGGIRVVDPALGHVERGGVHLVPRHGQVSHFVVTGPFHDDDMVVSLDQDSLVGGRQDDGHTLRREERGQAVDIDVVILVDVERNRHPVGGVVRPRPEEYVGIVHLIDVALVLPVEGELVQHVLTVRGADDLDLGDVVQRVRGDAVSRLPVLQHNPVVGVSIGSVADEGVGHSGRVLEVDPPPVDAGQNLGGEGIDDIPVHREPTDVVALEESHRDDLGRFGWGLDDDVQVVLVDELEHRSLRGRVENKNLLVVPEILRILAEEAQKVIQAVRFDLHFQISLRAWAKPTAVW